MTENVIASTLEQVKISCAQSNENGLKNLVMFSPIVNSSQSFKKRWLLYIGNLKRYTGMMVNA